MSIGEGDAGPRQPALSRAGAGGVSRRLGELAFLDRERPVEPSGQRGDVGRFDGRAAPDAQAGRGVAIGAYVVGDLLFLEQAREPLGEGRLAVGRQRRDFRIDDFQADAGVGARLRLDGEEIDPGRGADPVGDRLGIGVGARKQSFRPPMRFAQSRASI